MPANNSLVLLALLLLTTSCTAIELQDDDIAAIPGPIRLPIQHDEVPLKETAGDGELQPNIWEQLCPFGVPEDKSGISDDLKLLIRRDGYILKHHHVRKTAIFVCERPTRRHVHGHLSGRLIWRSDPQICPSASGCIYGATSSDYTNSGYDRGHLAPNMNQRFDPNLKKQTFYLSNAAPQVGAGFNRTIWANLERDLTVLVCDTEGMWTITGPLYLDRHAQVGEPHGFEKIGSGKVWVPSHFFKLVIWIKNHKLYGFAVALENRQHTNDDSYRNYLVSIDWLEKVSHLDLLPELGEDEEAHFHNNFSSFPTISWPNCQSICGEMGRCN